MRKFPYFISVVVVVLGVVATISFAHAQEAKAPNAIFAIFRKVEDVLTPEKIREAGLVNVRVKIKDENGKDTYIDCYQDEKTKDENDPLKCKNYIAVYPTQPSDPIETKDDQYIIANNFGPETTKKAERGELLPYYLTGEYLEKNPSLLVPVVKPATKPASAPAVTAQKPAEPASVPTPMGTIVPKVGKDGKIVKNQFVINYLVPDPANPGKLISMTSEVITKDTDVKLPNGKTQPWVAGKKYFLNENTNDLYPIRVEITVIEEKNGQKFKTTEVTTYMSDGKGGVIPRGASVGEDTLIIDVDDEVKPLITNPKTAPATKPVVPPAEEGKDYQAPTPKANTFNEWLGGLIRKPAEAPKDPAPLADPEKPKTPAAPRGRGKGSAPVKEGKDLSGGKVQDKKMVLTETEVQAGFKELNVRPVTDKESGMELGYRATVSYCPIDPKTGLEIVCISGMGTGNTAKEAKESAMDDAETKFAMSQKK